MEKPEQIPLNQCDQLKLIAARIALNYDCNIKIEISVDKNSGSVIITLTEFDVTTI